MTFLLCTNNTVVSFDQIRSIELDFVNRIVVFMFHIVLHTHQKEFFLLF